MNLRFTPHAWAKMQWFREKSLPNEVGAMGISDADDLLLVRDVYIPEQEVSGASVDFDDEDLGRLIDHYAQKGLDPVRVGRIWIHTHPFNSANPSGTDETTFAESFGPSDWAVMCILANHSAYARLRVTSPWGVWAATELGVRVDWTASFKGSAINRWERVFEEKVSERIKWWKGKGTTPTTTKTTTQEYTRPWPSVGVPAGNGAALPAQPVRKARKRVAPGNGQVVDPRDSEDPRDLHLLTDEELAELEAELEAQDARWGEDRKGP